jgi:hypothetical protein
MSLQFTQDQIESIAKIFFGEPNKALSSRTKLRFGSNGSKSVDLEKGLWYDHESKEGGDTFASIKKEIKATDRGVFEWLEERGYKERSHTGNGQGKPNDIPYDATSSDPFKDATFKKTNKQFHIVKTWSYTDAAGKELFQVCRLENGLTNADGKPQKEYRQRRHDPFSPDGYIYSVKGISQVPYRLSELIEAIAKEKLIFIVEGEKCADAVIALGGAATCNAMGAGKWPDELTPVFKNADVVILPDNDEVGAKHAVLVAEKLAGTAKRVRVQELPGLPAKGDVADWAAAGGTLAQLHALVGSTGGEPGSGNNVDDGPLPLFPPLQDAEPYPVDALGPTLSRAAKAIASKVQVPFAMASQSVLAAASLAVCSHADVMLPFGQARPLALFFATIAESGDRKTTADNEALWPVRRYEKTLRDEYDARLEEWRIEFATWAAQKRKIESGKMELAERKDSFIALGKEPEKPLSPFLIAGDPTIEGLTKNWPVSHAALGLFTSEGGAFVGGHAMNEDNRLKTAAMLSELWDGLPVKRVRAMDGIVILVGRRLPSHILIQPDAAAAFLSNKQLQDQGLLSRFLVARPESMAGRRPYKEMAMDDDAAIKAYGARLLLILETPPALAEGKRNELAPRALPLSIEATAVWIKFHDHVEAQLGYGGPLASIKAFASKAAEHAARLAGVITIVEDLHAREISLATMEGAITLLDWYISEALRIHQAGTTDPDLLSAKELLEWLQAQPDKTAHFREILRCGPNAIRMKAVAEKILRTLSAHGWITEASARPRIIKAVEA